MIFSTILLSCLFIGELPLSKVSEQIEQKGVSWKITYTFNKNLDKDSKIEISGKVHIAQDVFHSSPKTSKVSSDNLKFKIELEDKYAVCYEIMEYEIVKNKLIIILEHLHKSEYGTSYLSGTRLLKITSANDEFTDMIYLFKNDL